MRDHSFEYHYPKEPTCLEEGSKDYYYCYVCETKFTVEYESKPIEDEELIIPKEEHVDENKDYLCDRNCGKVFVDLESVIENTFSLSKVTVNEYANYDLAKTYYFDVNLMYVIDNKRQEEKCYYTENETTYLLTKKDIWEKEVTNEEISYILSYIFDNYNFEISSKIDHWSGGYAGAFAGIEMLGYTNSLGANIVLGLNEEGTLLKYILIGDKYNNIINQYEIVVGENKEISNTFEDIINNLERYIYDETTNTYLVDSSQDILDAINNAEVGSAVDNPATIKLMNDIEVEAIESEHGIVEYAILIETGTIIIDLNGYTLSTLNDPNSVIQLGTEWGEICNAVVTIEDSSTNKSGKIFAPYIGIYNQGGTLIFNNGTIEVNSINGDWTAGGIAFYLGTVTMNGGSVLVTSVADGWLTFGVSEDGSGGIFTMNGGIIKIEAPLGRALYLRGTAYINGGTIECKGGHVYSDATIYLGTNEEGVGATFVGGIKSSFTLNSILTEGVGYYDINGNLIEINDDVKEILDKGDIIVKRIS